MVNISGLTPRPLLEAPFKLVCPCSTYNLAILDWFVALTSYIDQLPSHAHVFNGTGEQCLVSKLTQQPHWSAVQA